MSAARASSSFALPAAAAAALLLAVLLWGGDLLTGSSVPFYRDIGTTQRPARALFASLGPASWNPAASFGQPYAGNPNFVLAYPTPRDPRFLGAHLLAHLAIGLLGAWLFFRRLVRSTGAAAAGSLAWALSGFVVSTTNFLNVATTTAWVPWVMWCVLLVRASTETRRLVLAGLALAGSIALLVLGGEPALGALALAFAGAFAASGPKGTRVRSLGALFAAGLVAALAISPWLLEVLRATTVSARRLRGFSWTEFAAVGFHPGRLLETPFPWLFGDPSHTLSGGFWGFGVTQGNPPYLSCLTFGVLPLALAVVFAVSARRDEGRFFLSAALVSLVAGLIPWLPGAPALYGWLKPLHSLRYPGKAVLVLAFSVAALCALGADRLLVEGALPRFRSRAAWVLGALAALFAVAGFAGRFVPDLPYRVLHAFWDPRFASDPRIVLGPIAERLPRQALWTAAQLLAGALLLRRGAADLRGGALLLAAIAADLLLAAGPAIPREPAAWLAQPSPLVKKAASLGGRVYERAGKDLDAVRYGALGPRPFGEVQSLGFAQARQGWALSGMPHGLRYAYDLDPDGSYTLLNRIATDVVTSRPWARRLKWLRAASVTGIIASDLPPGTPGVTPVATDTHAGVPVTLWALDAPLPGVRRCARVLRAGSVTEAVQLFERDDFDPATDVVAYGTLPEQLEAARDPAARVRVVRAEADALAFETSGALPALLHVDRSSTPRVRATVNGAAVKCVVADIHLIGIPVPAGVSTVALDLAP